MFFGACDPRRAQRDLKLMSKLRLILAVAFAALLVHAPARAQNFQTGFAHAILIDANSGAVLYEKGADDYVAPASTVKIMTAELIFHELAEGRLKLDDEYVISDHAWRDGGAQVARLRDVRQCEHACARRGPHSRPGDRLRQRRRDRARRGQRGLRRSLRDAHEQARRRARAQEIDLRQPLGEGQPGSAGDGARDGLPGRARHQHLSAILSLFRREGLLVEQHQAAQSQPAAQP